MRSFENIFTSDLKDSSDFEVVLEVKTGSGKWCWRQKVERMSRGNIPRQLLRVPKFKGNFAAKIASRDSLYIPVGILFKSNLTIYD